MRYLVRGLAWRSMYAIGGKGVSQLGKETNSHTEERKSSCVSWRLSSASLKIKRYAVMDIDLRAFSETHLSEQ